VLIVEILKPVIFFSTELPSVLWIRIDSIWIRIQHVSSIRIWIQIRIQAKTELKLIFYQIFKKST
jgi:hypothetical protein